MVTPGSHTLTQHSSSLQAATRSLGLSLTQRGWDAGPASKCVPPVFNGSVAAAVRMPLILKRVEDAPPLQILDESLMSSASATCPDDTCALNRIYLMAKSAGKEVLAWFSDCRRDDDWTR